MEFLSKMIVNLSINPNISIKKKKKGLNSKDFKFFKKNTTSVANLAVQDLGKPANLLQATLFISLTTYSGGVRISI